MRSKIVAKVYKDPIKMQFPSIDDKHFIPYYIKQLKQQPVPTKIHIKAQLYPIYSLKNTF